MEWPYGVWRGSYLTLKEGPFPHKEHRCRPELLTSVPNLVSFGMSLGYEFTIRQLTCSHRPYAGRGYVRPAGGRETPFSGLEDVSMTSYFGYLSLCLRRVDKYFIKIRTFVIKSIEQSADGDGILSAFLKGQLQRCG